MASTEKVAMYNIRDSYVGRAFTSAPASILSGIALFVVANISGAMLFSLAGWALTWVGIDTSGLVVADLIPIFTFGLAALSGIGILFILVDVWLIYELLYEEGIASRFFYLVAANCIGICVCACIPVGQFFPGLGAGLVAMSFLCGLPRIAVWAGARFLVSQR